ncbi:MAG: BrnT family toxin [Methylococcaceae bacterium]|nr:BrnT family toxin [Methylococcaceae bacterium]
MHFEWDTKKAASNHRKHGVTFEEATSALRDVFSATAHDPDHSEDEERFVTFGISSQAKARGQALRLTQYLKGPWGEAFAVTRKLVSPTGKPS